MDYSENPAHGPWHPSSRGSSYHFITGFRSLQDFFICLDPGLNVLLGSNGSGKTNFIDFLDFVTLLVNRNSAAAISASGGIARVFSQESLKRKIPRIVAKIYGLADLTPHLFSSRNTRKGFFNYEYEFDLRYSKYHTAVYIAHERLKFKNLHSQDDTSDCATTVGSIELSRRSPLPDDEVRWSAGTYLRSNASRNPLRHMHLHRLPNPTRRDQRPSAANTIERLNEARDQLLADPPSVGPDESFLSIRSTFPALDAVRLALSRARSFNLNPNVARAPDDISKAPNIEPDGAGLSSTIYHIQQTAKGEGRSVFPGRRFEKDALETIIAWTQMVIPDLEDITATADPHTGKYQVYLHVAGEGGNLKIPLQSTSDGTLKWLAYVCLVVAKGTEYTFEEPENFLHPKMQQFFVSLLRESIEASPYGYRYIVSTHSETIINHCQPQELVLFNFEDGKTRCRRVSNVDSVVKQVNETGFGLGYYFAHNALS